MTVSQRRVAKCANGRRKSWMKSENSLCALISTCTSGIRRGNNRSSQFRLRFRISGRKDRSFWIRYDPLISSESHQPLFSFGRNPLAPLHPPYYALVITAHLFVSLLGTQIRPGCRFERFLAYLIPLRYAPSYTPPVSLIAFPADSLRGDLSVRIPGSFLTVAPSPSMRTVAPVRMLGALRVFLFSSHHQ